VHYQYPDVNAFPFRVSAGIDAVGLDHLDRPHGSCFHSAALLEFLLIAASLRYILLVLGSERPRARN